MVTPASKKEAVRYCIEQYKFGERCACRLIGLSHHVYRYQPQEVAKQQAFKQRLQELFIQYPRYGYLLLHGLLKREGALQMEFVSDALFDGYRIRVLNIIDNYSREVVGQLVDFSISGQQVARFLDKVGQERGLHTFIVIMKQSLPVKPCTSRVWIRARD